MSSPNRKRSKITLETKKKIIDVSANQNSTELGKQFELPPSTIRRILQNKRSILNALEQGNEAKRIVLRPVKHVNIDEAVLLWVKTLRTNGISLNGPLLKEKALELANQLGIENFKASDGWLDKFKHRHSIVFKSIQGEAGSIDIGELNNWQKEVLQAEISNFSPNDVFNIDETGLFWKLLPNKTLCFKGLFSLYIKLPLFVIGKSERPRCFKNAKPPVAYCGNKKAWMTGPLFESWLKDWDKKLLSENRKVLLYVDNFSGHIKPMELMRISLKFFPPNTTAESQPCDQGIIQNLKVNYRRFLLRHRISTIDSNSEHQINLLKALHFLRRAWEEVKTETIERCFRKAGFVLGEDISSVINEEDEINNELNSLWTEYNEKEAMEGDLAEYLAVDQDVVIGGDLTFTEIAQIFSGSTQVNEEDNEGDEDVTEIEDTTPPVTLREAYDSLNILQRYVDQNPGEGRMKKCDALEDILFEDRAKKT